MPLLLVFVVFYFLLIRPQSQRMKRHQAQIAAVKKGDVKIVAEEYTDGWKPEVAQKNMEQILTRNNNRVDAVVAAPATLPVTAPPRIPPLISRKARTSAESIPPESPSTALRTPTL